MTRNHLVEASAGFWTDAELIALMNLAIHDLWGAINDNYKQYFVTLDVTNVSFAANATQLTGVPTDVFRIELIEPRDLSSTSANVNLVLVPKDYRDPDFVTARATDAQDPSNRTLFYAIFNEGAPVGAPVIKVSPKVTSAVNLTMLYVPVLPTITATSTNPVPGESDAALVAYTVAFARVKESETRTPDPEWLQIYATEKQNLLVRMTPRQTQEPEIADALFEPYW